MKAIPHTENDAAGLETLQSISAAKRFNAWMYATIKPFLKGRILELGAGIGNITDHILGDFDGIVISDFNPSYCNFLQKKYSQKPQVTAVLNIDLQDPCFVQTHQHLQGSFDTIVLLNVIEHLQDDGKCANYCHFLLRPGGHFIVLAPAYKFLFSELDVEIGHYRRYKKNALASLLEKNGFTIVQKQYFNATGIAGWLVFNKLLKRKAISTASMQLYDSFVPFSKRLDKLIANRFGLSAIVVGKKPEKTW